MSKETEAKVLYGTLCQTLDDMKWGYKKDEDNFIIHTSVSSNGAQQKIFIKIDAERQVMFLKAPVSLPVTEHTRSTLAQAVVIANFSILNGSFELDLNNGFLAFKIVVPFMESIVSKVVCNYMIGLSCAMTDKFNSKFQALAEGRMTLDEFSAFCR